LKEDQPFLLVMKTLYAPLKSSVLGDITHTGGETEESSRVGSEEVGNIEKEFSCETASSSYAGGLGRKEWRKEGRKTFITLYT